jgi:hypothetical protein
VVGDPVSGDEGRVLVRCVDIDDSSLPVGCRRSGLPR